MDLTRYVAALQDDLAQAAALGDDATADAGRRLAEAIESSLTLRLLDVLAEAAVGLSATLRAGHVELRLAGREPELVFVDESAPGDDTPAPGDDLSARITLRLPETLKTSLEAAAAKEGVSANAWIVRALSRALDTRSSSGRIGNRLQGFARS
ncbi:MAG: type II toxin-antitoxin system HicB family antitoxin [Thermoleophilia bacterium]|nr:type II toxin-antitoxin system HicB family antitoxin [Thermoleophilia bacterium]MDH5333566.1 type II toxin-antitoxin system HicB family antitoxin [Thermoleophilia bacterium]